MARKERKQVGKVGDQSSALDSQVSAPTDPITEADRGVTDQHGDAVHGLIGDLTVGGDNYPDA